MKILMLYMVLFLTLSTNVFAGDTDFALMVNDDAKLFTGIVRDITDENIYIMVVKKIKGELIENKVMTVPKFDYLVHRNGNVESMPKINDNLFVAMIGDKFIYGISTTSTDPKTLKFINHLTNESMNMRGDSIYERIEQKVNDGSYEEAEKKRQEKYNTKETQEVNTIESTNEERVNDGLDNVEVKIVIGVMTIIGVLVFLFIRRKR